MLRNHQFFVGRHDINGNTAVGPRYLAGVPGIRGRIEHDAEPGQLLGNAGADRGRVLADPRGEHESVEALQRRRQHAGIEADPVDEVVDRERRTRVGAGFELAHVVADAGQALQAAVAVKEILHVRCRHALFRDEIEHDAGIELARPRSHRKPVERREAHRALDALSALDRAHRGAAAEMGDDHASARDVRRDLRQALGDIFVGQAVEAVAPDAFGMELVRDRVMVGERIVVAMEGGIEAGDLRQCREIAQQRPDRRQVVRLMQRRQRDVALQPRHDRMIDQHRASMIRPAMDDAMADGDGVDVEFVAQPGAGDRHRGRHIRHRLDRIGPVGQRIAGRAAGAQSRTAADPVHLALDLPLQPALAFHREDLKLDAGGAGIDDEDRVHGDHAAAIGALRRRALA